MNLINLEYWVLQCMDEANIAYQNGEVPVGCLFIIDKNKFTQIIKNKESDLISNKYNQLISDSTKSNQLSSNHNIFSTSRSNQFNSKLKDSNYISNESTLAGNYICLCSGKNEVNITKNATRHAEMICIDFIINNYPNYYIKLFENIYVIVNVEPCIMCMSALLNININNIVFTCINDRFGYNIISEDRYTNYIEINNTCEISQINSKEEEINKLKDEDSQIQNIKMENDKLESNNLGEVRESNYTEINYACESIQSNSKEEKNNEFKDEDSQIQNIKTENDKLESNNLGEISKNNSKLCNVYHYKKYQIETINILKLFYKGVNPNAPKHKVKIK